MIVCHIPLSCSAKFSKEAAAPSMEVRDDKHAQLVKLFVFLMKQYGNERNA